MGHEHGLIGWQRLRYRLLPQPLGHSCSLIFGDGDSIKTGKQGMAELIDMDTALGPQHTAIPHGTQFPCQRKPAAILKTRKSEADRIELPEFLRDLFNPGITIKPQDAVIRISPLIKRVDGQHNSVLPRVRRKAFPGDMNEGSFSSHLNWLSLRDGRDRAPP